MKKTLLILGGIICGIICIFLFGLQIAFMSFTSAKSLIARDSIKEIVNEMSIKDIVSSDPETASSLYGAFDTLGFSTEETDRILESESFKKFLDEYLYNNIEDVLSDKNVPTNYDAVVNLVSDIENETNIKFHNKEAFLKLLEKEYPKIEKSINISNSIKESMGKENLEVLRIILGNTITIVFVVLFIFTYLVMCLFRWSFYKPLIWFGITTTLSSFIMTQVFVALGALSGLITDETYKTFEPIISPILKVMKNKGLTVSLIMLAIGILMIVAFVFIHKRAKEEEKNENFDMLDNKEPQTL